MAKAIRLIVGNLALLSIYFITASYGLKVSAINGFAATIWPPSGISLAAIFIFGQWLWPGVALGAFFTNLVIGAPIEVALCIAIGNTMEAVLAVALLRRFDFHATFQRTKDVFTFFVIAFAATFISAMIGVSSHFFSKTLVAPFAEAFRSWWMGDIGGDLFVASFLLIWSNRSFPSYSARKIIELVILSVFVGLSSILIFTDWLLTPPSHFPRTYLIFPVMILVAIRLDQRAVITANLFVAAIVLGTTIIGHGPFWTGSSTESLFHAQIFLSILVGSKTILSAAIAERKDKEVELRNSNAQNEAVLKASIDGIITMNHLGQVTEFNPSATRIFGYAKRDVLGKPLAELIIPLRFREQHKRGLATYLRTRNGPVLGNRIEMPALRADGSEFPAELFIEPMNMPGPPMFTGFIQDISEKKQVDKERKQSEEDIVFLAEATKIISSSIDFKLTFQNIARSAQPKLGDFCALLLFPTADSVALLEYSSSLIEKQTLIKENIEGFLSQLTEASKIRTSFLINDVSDASLLATGLNKINREFIINIGIKAMMLVPLYSRDQSIGVIAIAKFSNTQKYNRWDLNLFEELSRRAVMALENARLYKEAKEAIYARDEFLSIASHELRTPLTSLSLQLQILARGIKASHGNNEKADTITLPIKVASGVGICEAQSKRLAALLDELLDLTRIRLGRLHLSRELVDLAALVKEAVAPFNLEAEQKGIRILVENLQPSMGNWDRIRMEQIVSNLISNALKYGDGKPISISIQNDKANNLTRLVVKDEGIGISREMQKKLFERFERAGISGKKISGLGLGLYITRQIVEAHGGRIFVKSEVGKGSTFTVELPFDQNSTQRNVPEILKAG